MLKLVLNLAAEANDILSLSLDEIARAGARRLLLEALDLEVEEYIQKHKGEVDTALGRRLVVRNGRGRSRKVTTGAGTVEVRAPRVNDKRDGHSYHSSILLPYLRKSADVESILPILYLKGLSGNACDLLGPKRPELPILGGFRRFFHLF